MTTRSTLITTIRRAIHTEVTMPRPSLTHDVIRVVRPGRTRYTMPLAADACVVPDSCADDGRRVVFSRIGGEYAETPRHVVAR